MFIDTHGHISFNAFRADADEVLRRALDNEIWVVMPGTQYSTSKRAVEIAERCSKGVYAAVGIHPIHVGVSRKVDVMEVESEEKREEPWMLFETRAEEFDARIYRELAGSKKVVAIGEVGLDYYHFPKNKEKRSELKRKQQDVLLRQIKLALALDLPIIFHCRVAHEDALDMIAELQKKHAGALRGVMHSYTGTAEQAQKFMELGFDMGFNGLIFKHVPALPDPREVISAIPLERIVLETDAPYLVPPQAGTERNEPLFVRYLAERIAEIKGTTLQEVANQTTQNAKRLFSLED